MGFFYWVKNQNITIVFLYKTIILAWSHVQKYIIKNGFISSVRYKKVIN